MMINEETEIFYIAVVDLVRKIKNEENLGLGFRWLSDLYSLN